MYKTFEETPFPKKNLYSTFSKIILPTSVKLTENGLDAQIVKADLREIIIGTRFWFIIFRLLCIQKTNWRKY